MGIFDERRVNTKGSQMSTGREDKGRKKSGVYYTSEMQGILAIKDKNETKAAILLSEYMTSLAETTYDEKVILSNMSKMLEGWTVEEQLRIVSKALATALCKIA